MKLPYKTPMIQVGAFLACLLSCAFCGASQKLLIDLGSVASAQPSADGYYWNTLTSSLGTTIASGGVVDHEGNTLNGVSIHVASTAEAAFDHAGDLRNGTQYPDSVARDGFVVHGTGTSGADVVTLTLAGFAPLTEMDISFYGATPYTSWSRYARCRVNATDDIYFNNAENTFHTAVLYSVTSTASGEVTIELDAYRTSSMESRQGYLNAIEITLNPPENMYVDWRKTALPSAGLSENQRVGFSDPDGDGLCNMVEYFLATDPLAANAFAQVTIDDSSPQTEMVYEYARSSTTQATIRYEVSENLQDWTQVNLSETLVNPDIDGDGKRELVQVRLPVGGGTPAQYLRFQVEDTTMSRQLTYPFIKVACVGDSITYGTSLQDRNTQSYPAQLGAALSFNYEVKNFGISGSTMLKNGDKPYWNQWAFGAAKDYNPDVVIIKLGTNDSKPWNWSSKANYIPNYRDMIGEFQAQSSEPLVVVGLPCPAYTTNFSISGTVVEGEIVPWLTQMAREDHLLMVDFFTAMSGKSQYFPDGIHPNADGYTIMAQTAKAVVEKATYMRTNWKP